VADLGKSYSFCSGSIFVESNMTVLWYSLVLRNGEM